MLKPTDDNQHTDDINLNAEVEHVNFHNPENGWCVLKIRDVHGSQTLTAVGYLPEVSQGQYFVFSGRWGHHKTFGQQFKFSRAVVSRPNNREGIKRYLCSGLFKGVGKVTAEKIVKKFGLETFKILDDDPEQLKLIPKLNKKVANKIIEEWQNFKQTHERQMFLLQHGISGLTAQKLMQKYGPNLMADIADNPYRLIAEVRGIGFQRADQIGRSMGIDLNHPRRIQAGILYLLAQGEDQGHCYQTTRQILQRFQNQLQLPDITAPELYQHMKPLTDSLKLTTLSRSDGESADDVWHFRASLLEHERQIAENISAIQSGIPSPPDTMSHPELITRITNWVEQYCKRSGSGLSEQQKRAVLLAATEKVFILTGGPGVGKTTTANVMIRLFQAMGKSIALAAPTGRAAQRLSEVSGREAKTIHRLLEWSAQENCFKRGPDNPLPAQVIMIDEASMLDARLADSLIAAVPESAQLVLMGDVDQLPSVGPGNILRDLINSDKISCQVLDQVFRQAAHSEIVSAAHQINKGSLPEFSGEDSSDCRFMPVQGSEHLYETLKNLLTIHLPAAGYDPLKDVQILTPMNKGDMGCQRLNPLIQGWINPTAAKSQAGLSVGKSSFCEHDKVIQGVNNYDLGVFNGDIGYVDKTGVEGSQLLVSMNDKDVSYDSEQVRDLSLAYAITIHKSQGSEFPVVIIPLSMSHYVMLQRNLIYTALTRAKKLAIFLGDMKALQAGVRSTSSLSRQTWLIHELNPEHSPVPV